MRWIVAAVLVLLPVACKQDRRRAARLETFRGEFRFAFQAEGFSDCRGEEDWEVRHDSPAYEQLLTRVGIDSALAAGEKDTAVFYPNVRAWLVFRGDTSPVGRYGPDRTSTHEVWIDSLVSARRLAPDSIAPFAECRPDVGDGDGPPAS